MSRLYTENKRCPIYCKNGSHGLLILLPENSNKSSDYPICRIRIKTFLNSCAIWTLLGLDTIYWDKPIYGIYNNLLELEYTKIEYLMGFVSDVPAISMKWARDLLQITVENVNIEDEVYFEIIIFDNTLKEKLINIILGDNMRYIEDDHIFIVIDN